MTEINDTVPQGYFHAIPHQPDCLQSCDPGGHTIALGHPNLVDGDYYAKGAVRGLHAFLRATALSEKNTGFEMLGDVLEQFAIMGGCLRAHDCDNFTRTQIAFNLEMAKTHVAHLLADEALAARLIRASAEKLAGAAIEQLAREEQNIIDDEDMAAYGDTARYL